MAEIHEPRALRLLNVSVSRCVAGASDDDDDDADEADDAPAACHS
jgi:hypothetical protein